jgi:hypothetical protein
LLKKNGPEDANVEIAPNVSHDSLTVQGDAWITINPHQEGDNYDGLIIAHTESDLGEAITIDTLANIQEDEANNQDIDLIHAGYLKANQITVDSRGHITTVKPIYYQLPDVSNMENRIMALESQLTWKNLNQE